MITTEGNCHEEDDSGGDGRPRPDIVLLAIGLFVATSVGKAQPVPSVAVTSAASFTLYTHNRSAASVGTGDAGLDSTTEPGSGVEATSDAGQIGVAAAMDAFSRKAPPSPDPERAPWCAGVDAVPWRPGLTLDTHARRRIWWPAVRAAECRYQLPPGLFDSLVVAESRYRAGAISRAGAGGLAQLMPATAVGVGVVNRFDVVSNIDGGARYLRQLLDRFQSVPLAVAAYNAGPGAVIRARGIPANGETPGYVRAVLDGWSALGSASNASHAVVDERAGSSAQLIVFAR